METEFYWINIIIIVHFHKNIAPRSHEPFFHCDEIFCKCILIIEQLVTLFELCAIDYLSHRLLLTLFEHCTINYLSHRRLRPLPPIDNDVSLNL